MLVRVWIAIAGCRFLSGCCLSSRPHKCTAAQNCLLSNTEHRCLLNSYVFQTILSLFLKDVFMPPAWVQIFCHMPLTGREAQGGICIWKNINFARKWRMTADMAETSNDRHLFPTALAHILNGTARSRVDEAEAARITRVARKDALCPDAGGQAPQNE